MGSCKQRKESMNKKVNCTCGHTYEQHPLPTCLAYDPAGHNPDVVNVLCPHCGLVRLEPFAQKYVCVACQCIMDIKING